jgi:hypothetical protein
VLTPTDCHLPGTVACVPLPPDLAGEKIMNTFTRAAVYTVRIAAVTAAAPVLAGAAASSATAKLAGWELRQLASSPLSAQGRRLKAELRELAAANGAGATTPARQQGHAGNGRDRHRPNSAPARSGQARAQLTALNSSR